MAKLKFLTWLRIGSGMLQVHKELQLIVSFPLYFPRSFPAENDIRQLHDLLGAISVEPNS
jgi:hypothetical protein